MAFTLHILESEPVALIGLKSILATNGHFQLAGTSSDLEAALQTLDGDCPNVFLLSCTEINRVTLTGMATLRGLRPACDTVLWVSRLSKSDERRAMQAGARAIIAKSTQPDSMLECLLAVAEGKIWSRCSTKVLDPKLGRLATMTHLSPRERQIVERVCRGLKNKEIAAELSIAVGTVKIHLVHIFEKTGVANRFELAEQGRLILDSQDKFLQT